jgi:hypothetical protein
MMRVWVLQESHNEKREADGNERNRTCARHEQKDKKRSVMNMRNQKDETSRTGGDTHV